MELTMKRTDAGTMRRVAIKAMCVVLGCGTAASAVAMQMQVAMPVDSSAPAIAQVAAQPNPVQQGAAKPAPMPGSFTLAVPRSATGQPAQSFKVDVNRVAVAEASPEPAPMRVTVLTPPAVEPDQAPGSTDTAQVSANVMAGNILTKVNPVYPEMAKAAKVQGAVVLHAIIAKDGTMKSLAVVSGPPELVMSSMEAVRQWTYRPYLLNGEPTEVDTTITVNYSLAQ
jgi:TonB family protein